MSFVFQPMSEEYARSIAGWRYEEPYAIYSSTPEDFVLFMNPANRYYSVTNEHSELVGYICFGKEAQVPGGDYDDSGALDIGVGLRPDLTGQGLGPKVLAAALTYAEERFSPARFRVTVASFNARSLRMCEKVGFRQLKVFMSPRGQFILLVREA